MNRVLIVDPDAGPRAELEQIFADRGDDVRYALGEEDALETVARFHPTVALCLAGIDAKPGSGGAALCARLRRSQGPAQLVIVLYARGPLSARDLRAAYAAGASAVAGPDQVSGIDAIVDAQLSTQALLRRATESCAQLRDDNLRLERETREQLARVVSEHATHPEVVANEIIASHPDGVLVIAADGKVVSADVGARELMGQNLVGRPIGSIAPRSRLGSFVGAVSEDDHVRFAFDVDARSDRASRTLQATVTTVRGGNADGVERVVLLVDLDRRGPAECAVRNVTSRVPDEYYHRLLAAARAHNALDAIPHRAPASARLLHGLTLAARHLHPVLLRGPAGSGRRASAEVLHHATRATGPLLEMACDGLEDDSQDVVLFGDRSANGERTPGLVARAKDGTLVLLEIEHLAFAMQSKLAAIAKDPHLRIVATTTSRADALVSAGSLLPELAEAFAGAAVDVPPLRDRREDLPELILRSLGRDTFRRLTPSALRALALWDWPDGVPEFEAELARLGNVSSPQIEVLDLDPEIARHAAVHASEEDLRDVELSPFGAAITMNQWPIADEEPVMESREPTESPRKPKRRQRAPRAGAWIPEPEEWAITDDDPIDLEHYQKKAVLRAIFESRGNRTQAAELLGVGKSTFYRKLAKWGLTGEGT